MQQYSFVHFIEAKPQLTHNMTSWFLAPFRTLTKWEKQAVSCRSSPFKLKSIMKTMIIFRNSVLLGSVLSNCALITRQCFLCAIFAALSALVSVPSALQRKISGCLAITFQLVTHLCACALFVIYRYGYLWLVVKTVASCNGKKIWCDRSETVKSTVQRIRFWRWSLKCQSQKSILNSNSKIQWRAPAWHQVVEGLLSMQHIHSCHIYLSALCVLFMNSWFIWLHDLPKKF